MMPCEYAIWKVLPAIRKELAITLVQKYNLSQKEVSKKLAVTEAAVSLYIKSRRGNNVRFDKKSRKIINKIAVKMLKSKSYEDDICKLCKMLSKVRR